MKCCMLGLFSFLSGLLLSMRYNINSKQNVVQFYKRRFLRIYPLFLVSLTGFFLTSRIDLRTYISSILLINMFLPLPLQTLWFVTMILVFYVFTPLFLYKYNHTRTIVLSVLILVSWIVIHLTTQLIDSQLPLYFVPFVMGILVGRATTSYVIIQRKYTVGIGIVSFLSAYYFLFHFDQEILKMITIDVAILAAIPPFFAMGRILIRWVPATIISFLSISSFGVYLIHRFTFAVGLRFHNPRGVLLSIIYLGFIILPITFIIAYFVQNIYDSLLRFRIFNRLRKYVKKDIPEIYRI